MDSLDSGIDSASSENGGAKSPTSGRAMRDNIGPETVGSHPAIDPSAQGVREDLAEKVYVPQINDQLRTPTSENPLSVQTLPASWTSHGSDHHLYEPQLEMSKDVRFSTFEAGSYFTPANWPNPDNAEFSTVPSTSNLSCGSDLSFVAGQQDTISTPQSPDDPANSWRNMPNQISTGSGDTSRPNSVTTHRSEPTYQKRRQVPDHPNYPDQSFAALHSQHYPPPYRPHPLRTRSSHPSQNLSYSSGASKRSQDLTSMSQGAKTVGNTPAQSPGLFSPTFAPNRPSTEGSEDGQYNTPLLHPTHLQAPKETHKLLKDIDPISGRKLVNNYEFFEKLGSGQHGTVKLGRNLETGDLVAVKIVRRFSKKLRLGKPGDPNDMIRKEVAILKKARHPHVVSLLEVIDDDEFGKVYLVLEYVELGEIIWRKQTDKDVATFEMNRAKREMANHFHEDDERAEVDKFNSSAQARRLEKARVFEEQTLEARMSLQRKTSDTNNNNKLTTGPDAYWSLEYGDESEGEQAPKLVSGSSKACSETGRAPSSDSLSSAARAQSSSKNTTPVQSESPKRPLSVSNPATHPAVIDLRRESRPASPIGLEGTMYGPYFSDERSSDVALQSTLERIVALQSRWTEEEEEFMYVPCLTISQALDAFRDTVLGLEYLHYQGIIHRDIKPANLLWTADHRVKISDFGVSYLGKPIREDDNNEEIPEADAAILDEAIELAKTVGTPAFYAPELCDPELFDFGKHPERPQITGQIDVWALGVTLYGMIFGRLPFFDANEFTMYEKIARQEVFIPRMRLKGVEDTIKVPMNSNKRLDDIVEYEEVDDELRDLLKRLLHKQPSKRITLKEVKHHPWVLRGIKEQSVWIDETDPSLQSHGKKIEVSTQDVQDAVIGLTFFDRVKSGIKRLGSVVRGRDRDSRKRTDSSAKTPESPASSGHTPHASTGLRDWRRSSLRGDEQILSALRASRDGSEHPLSQSVAASPEVKTDTSYFDGSTMPYADVIEPPRLERPTLGRRMLSTAESTKTIRAPVYPVVRDDITPASEAFSPMTTVPDQGSTSSLGGIFGGAGRRFVNSMRSRERGQDRESHSQSSRSSSVDPDFPILVAAGGRRPSTLTIGEDPHGSPSVAYSSAVAAGHLDQPPILEDSSLSHTSPMEPVTSSPKPRFPGDPLAEAFQLGQNMNHRRRTLEFAGSASNHRRSTISSAAAIACPPSPDDEFFHAKRRSTPITDEAPSVGISSSSDQLPSAGMSESTSHPSIPSVVSGASSLSATVDPGDYLPLTKDFTSSTVVARPPSHGSQTSNHHDEQSNQPSTKANHPLAADDDEAGWNGDGEQESDSDDGGLVMGSSNRRLAR